MRNEKKMLKHIFTRESDYDIYVPQQHELQIVDTNGKIICGISKCDFIRITSFMQYVLHTQTDINKRGAYFSSMTPGFPNKFWQFYEVNCSTFPCSFVIHLIAPYVDNLRNLCTENILSQWKYDTTKINTLDIPERIKRQMAMYTHERSPCRHIYLTFSNNSWTKMLNHTNICQCVHEIWNGYGDSYYISFL